MNRQRRAESFAKEVTEHLEKCNLNLPKEELLSAGYYWGISEVIGEIEMLLIKSELNDSTLDNLNIVKEIRNYIKSIL
jgi:hypothetical protein